MTPSLKLALRSLRESKYDHALMIYRNILEDTKSKLESGPTANSFLAKETAMSSARVNDYNHVESSFFAHVFVLDDRTTLSVGCFPTSVVLYNIAVTYHLMGLDRSVSDVEVSHVAFEKARSFYNLSLSLTNGKVQLAARNNLLSLAMQGTYQNTLHFLGLSLHD